MLNNQFNLNSDILVVGHHGSSSSTSSQFLNAVNPQYAVISCERNNSYGHPASDVLERLVSKNITVLRTDLAGTIEFTIKNNSISYNTEKMIVIVVVMVIVIVTQITIAAAIAMLITTLITMPPHLQLPTF